MKSEIQGVFVEVCDPETGEFSVRYYAHLDRPLGPNETLIDGRPSNMQDSLCVVGRALVAMESRSRELPVSESGQSICPWVVPDTAKDTSLRGLACSGRLETPGCLFSIVCRVGTTAALFAADGRPVSGWREPELSFEYLLDHGW